MKVKDKIVKFLDRIESGDGERNLKPFSKELQGSYRGNFQLGILSILFALPLTLWFGRNLSMPFYISLNIFVLLVLSFHTWRSFVCRVKINSESIEVQLNSEGFVVNVIDIKALYHSSNTISFKAYDGKEKKYYETPYLQSGLVQKLVTELKQMKVPCYENYSGD